MATKLPMQARQSAVLNVGAEVAKAMTLGLVNYSVLRRAVALPRFASSWLPSP